MTEKKDWERLRHSAISTAVEAEAILDRQQGDKPREAEVALVMASCLQAKATALVAVFLADLVEPVLPGNPSTPGDPKSIDALIANIKKGDDRGPGYSID